MGHTGLRKLKQRKKKRKQVEKKISHIKGNKEREIKGGAHINIEWKRKVFEYRAKGQRTKMSKAKIKKTE